MKGAAARFGVALALLMMLCGNRAMAQTPQPPKEPSDFSAYFVGFDYLALHNSTTQGLVSPDGLGFQNFGFWFPGIPGTVTGDLFEDYTNKRERFDIGTTDPNSPTQLATIWKFYDKNITYFVWHATNQCTKLNSSATIQPFFMDLANSSFLGQTGFPESILAAATLALLQTNPPGNVWSHPLSGKSAIEFGTAANAGQTPLFVAEYAPGRITRLQFEIFKSGQPDASVFSLPAACAG